MPSHSDSGLTASSMHLNGGGISNSIPRYHASLGSHDVGSEAGEWPTTFIPFNLFSFSFNAFITLAITCHKGSLSP